MSKLFQVSMVAAVTLLILASHTFAQEQQPRGRGRGMRSPTQLPSEITLTDEQKAKIADIEKKYADKLKAATEKSALTEEQRGKQREAFQKVRQDGLQGEAAQKAIAEALGLTDDQKKGREELTALTAEITKEVEGVLTDEQKAKLKEIREQRGRRGRGTQRPST